MSNLIDCPFCFGAVNEESMARHIEWHFPDVEDLEPPVYGAIDSDKQVFEL